MVTLPIVDKLLTVFRLICMISRIARNLSTSLSVSACVYVCVTFVIISFREYYIFLAKMQKNTFIYFDVCRRIMPCAYCTP